MLDFHLVRKLQNVDFGYNDTILISAGNIIISMKIIHI